LHEVWHTYSLPFKEHRLVIKMVQYFDLGLHIPVKPSAIVYYCINLD